MYIPKTNEVFVFTYIYTLMQSMKFQVTSINYLFKQAENSDEILRKLLRFRKSQQ